MVQPLTYLQVRLRLLISPDRTRSNKSARDTMSPRKLPGISLPRDSASHQVLLGYRSGRSLHSRFRALADLRWIELPRKTSFWMNTAWYKLKSISASWLSYSCIRDPLLNLFSILLFSYGNRTERSTGLGISWPVVRVSLLKLYLANVLSSRTMHMVCWLSE